MSDPKSDPKSDPTRPATRAPSTIAQVLDEQAHAMARYALARGSRIPTEVLGALDGKPTVAELGEAHATLAALVAPASPQVIARLESSPGKGRGVAALVWYPGAVPMMICALVGIAGFIALHVIETPAGTEHGNVTTAQGLGLLSHYLSFVCAAMVGAAFAALFEVMQRMIDLRYDPVRAQTYRIEFLLGIIAGVTMAVILHLQAPSDGKLLTGADASALRLSAGGLAMLGGFSSHILYRVLNRMANAILALLTGEMARDPVATSSGRGRDATTPGRDPGSTPVVPPDSHPTSDAARAREAPTRAP